MNTKRKKKTTAPTSSPPLPRKDKCPTCGLLCDPLATCSRCGTHLPSGTKPGDYDPCPMCGANLLDGCCGWCYYKEALQDEDVPQ